MNKKNSIGKTNMERSKRVIEANDKNNRPITTVFFDCLPASKIFDLWRRYIPKDNNANERDSSRPDVLNSTNALDNNKDNNMYAVTKKFLFILRNW